MVMRNGEIVTDDEGGDNESEDDDMPALEDASDARSVEEPVRGDLYVARRALSTQLKEDGPEEQRENLFHSRCHVQGKACSVIIDGGNCTNVVSTLLVNRLGLPTVPHLRLYKL